MKRWWRLALALVLLPAVACAENLSVQVSLVLGQPTGYLVIYDASPQSGLIIFGGEALVPYSASNQQITAAIADHAKGNAASHGITVNQNDTVKVFGGPSN